MPLKVFVASPLGRGGFVRGDVHGDDAHDISDAIATLGCLFLGGACPPAPFPSCGSDPTPDSLECTEIGFNCP